uniref:Kelch-like protein n=1 Tax=Gouania willdenowi TaxID=441366 RepID=A0A8C5DH63_GOUWI
MAHLFFYSTVFLGRCFYIVGSGLSWTDPCNRVWRFNLVTHTWQEMSPMQESRYSVIVAYMGHIFAVGGSDGSRDLSSAEAYDPVTNTWYDVPEMVHTHSYFDIAVMNKQIFVVSCKTLSVHAAS